MLDLAGYTTDKPLFTFRVLEPSFGDGDFLVPLVGRLLSAYFSQESGSGNVFDDLASAVRAVEIHPRSVATSKSKLLHLFEEYEIPAKDALLLIDQWIITGDFLLADFSTSFTHVIGNPPYVRQEMIPPDLLAKYRSRFSTLYDRADLYVPFIEKCLHHLSSGGVLAFICADRWMKNKYGGPLRTLVSKQFHLACYIDMVNTPAFLSDVSAYPAITLIKRERPGVTRIACRPKIEQAALSDLAAQLNAEESSGNSDVLEVMDVARKSEPWILTSFPQLAIVRKLESAFPSIEESGCKVGIGVATGADRIYTGSLDVLDVEPDRKLPLVKPADIKTGEIRWQGCGVINPFNDDGSLVNLADFPKLDAYLSRHADIIKHRNCARRNPHNWYRTIDRITPSLTSKPKLLIPDIKSDAHIVYDEGHYYPHHNLYFITSEEWNLHALQKVLKSGIARLFVSLYSTQMRGGYLRFQAQYIRRIRLPRWYDVPERIRKTLTTDSNLERCNHAVFDLYQLTSHDRKIIMSKSSMEFR